jgi:thymidylate synthase
MPNNLDIQYQQLLQDILDNGVEKMDRTSTGTVSVFGRQIRHNMKDGFPLLTTKKMAWKSIVTELIWFLKGDTNIKWLLEQNNNIWTGDAYKNYLKWAGNNPLTMEEFIGSIKADSDFAGVYGELGPIYGKQWRSWKSSDTKRLGGTFWGPTTEIIENSIDQIAILINDLKTNPDSRRLMVNAWNVGELDEMVLPPCHFSFQCYSHEKDGKRYLSLAWNQRSCDTFLGLPFNIASYGLLLEIIAKEVNMVPDQLIGNLGDTHLYSNHIEQAKEQITREPFELPKLQFNPIFLYNMEHKGFDEAINGQINFQLDNYQSHSVIKAPLSN